MQICGSETQKLVEQFESPLFVYNQDTITQKCKNLLEGLKAFSTKTKALYACKANTNPHILKTILEAGITGIDTVSIQECMIALQCGFKKEDILYTENYMSDQELQFAIENKILINVGELKTLEKIGQRYPGTEVAIRINPDIGSGENSHVITGGSESKFGIYFTQFQEVLDIVKKYDIKIVGIHQHIGSNICQADIDKYIGSAKCIFETSLHFLETIRFINIGGGIGVPYQQLDQSMNLYEAYQKIADLYTTIFKSKAQKDVEIWCEPGRYLVADSGYLLCTATAIKKNPFYTYIGTDTGMNHLIRPAFYGSHHEIENTTNYNVEKSMKSTICGNICESSDIFAKDRMIQLTKEGDILAIFNAGAYCFSMANNYNARFKPAEVLLSKNLKEPLLIRRRETFQDLMQTVVNF